MEVESKTQCPAFNFVCSLQNSGEMYSSGGDVYNGFGLLGVLFGVQV